MGFNSILRSGFFFCKMAQYLNNNIGNWLEKELCIEKEVCSIPMQSLSSSILVWRQGLNVPDMRPTRMGRDSVKFIPGGIVLQHWHCSSERGITKHSIFYSVWYYYYVTFDRQ